MKKEKDIKRFINLCKPIDYRFKYILTIKLNKRFNDCNSLDRFNLLSYYSRNYLITQISKITKSILSNRKYSKLKHISTKNHLLVITPLKKEKKKEKVN